MTMSRYEQESRRDDVWRPRSTELMWRGMESCSTCWRRILGRLACRLLERRTYRFIKRHNLFTVFYRNSSFIIKVTCYSLVVCRALEFFCAFTSLLVSEYRSGSLDDSLLTVVYLAYDQSLRQHHNWLMRGTFYVRTPSRHRQWFHVQ